MLSDEQIFNALVMSCADGSAPPSLAQLKQDDNWEDIRNFAHAIETAVREECSALHDHPDVLAPIGNSAYGEAFQEGWIAGTSAYQTAIREGAKK